MRAAWAIKKILRQTRQGLSQRRNDPLSNLSFSRYDIADRREYLFRTPQERRSLLLLERDFFLPELSGRVDLFFACGIGNLANADAGFHRNAAVNGGRFHGNATQRARLSADCLASNQRSLICSKSGASTLLMTIHSLPAAAS